MPPQIPRGGSPACLALEALAASCILIDTLFITTREWRGTDAGVPTRPASHAPRRLRPKQVRPRSRVSGLTAKLVLVFSSESFLRTEPPEDLAVRLSFWVPKEASTAAPLEGLCRQQGRSQFPAAIGRARSRRALSYPLQSPAGKQSHCRVSTVPGGGHPPAATGQTRIMASSGEDESEGGGPQATVLSTVSLASFECGLLLCSGLTPGLSGNICAP